MHTGGLKATFGRDKLRAETRYHFDEHGNYLGYVDEVGHYRDRDGIYRGALSDSGIRLDENGRYHGHVDVQGRCWDLTGRSCGYLLTAAGRVPFARAS